MQKRYIYLFIAAILLALFVLYSCNEPNVVENKKAVKQEKRFLKRQHKGSNFLALTKHHFTLSNLSKDSLARDEIKIHNKIIITDLSEIRKEKLTKYLNTHKVSKNNNLIQPDYFNCGDHFTFYWEPEELYRSKSGKWLGIWPPSGINWTKLHDIYGFTNIIVNFSYVSSALADHFKHDSIMINLKGTNPSEIINNESFNYYFVDEPNENEINETDIWAYSQNISSKNVNGKLLLSDYMWPYRNLFCYFASGDLDIMNEYLRYSNEYIMCDQYDGNACGDDADFWNEYKSVYGMPSKNLSNWITLKQSDSDEWDNLLNIASSWSALGAMNPIWIYGGGGSGADENTIRQFCLYSAWPDGWIEGKSREYEVYWKCDNPNPCNTCDWNNQDDWYIYAVYPVAEQWF